jgi:hypothetical protein
MIHYDQINDQILTPLCRQCPEEYFKPLTDQIPHVGCCSYSPVFTLFEVYKIIKEDQIPFFLENIYHNPKATIFPYEIEVHARVHLSFEQYDSSSFTQIEKEDLRIKFSVCQYFEQGKGCGLPPLFKTSVCRSFICSSVEERLDRDEKRKFTLYVRKIRSEASQFNLLHKKRLVEKGINFVHHLPQVLDYLKKQT